MGDFPIDQRLRDHADDLTAGGERRVGEAPHQSNAGATVDEADAPAREDVAEMGRQPRENRRRPETGAAKHAHPRIDTRRARYLVAAAAASPGDQKRGSVLRIEAQRRARSSRRRSVRRGTKLG